MSPTAPPTDTPQRTTTQITYRAQIPAIMLCAFVLSIVHTVYAWVAGIEDPGFTVTTPLTWCFYLVALAVTALAMRQERWAQATVLGFLVAIVLIGIFYYPTVFVPSHQTAFGWFENDVYLGLLIVALYLSIHRLRGTDIVSRRADR